MFIVEQDTIKIMKRAVGLVLLTGIAFCVTAVLLWFFGSPWGKSSAKQTAEAYLAQQYPNTQLITSKAQFDFPSHSYLVQVQNPAAADSDFWICTDKRQILWDSYNQDVLQKGNIVRRLEQSYTLQAQDLLAQAELSENIQVVAHLDLDKVSLLQQETTDPTKASLTYNLMLIGETENPSIEAAASLVTQAFNGLANTDCAFSSYGVQLYKENK